MMSSLPPHHFSGEFAQPLSGPGLLDLVNNNSILLIDEEDDDVEDVEKEKKLARFSAGSMHAFAFAAAVTPRDSSKASSALAALSLVVEL